MEIHVGVDLHQRFCYATAMDASGRVLAQRSIVNEAEPLRRWLQTLPAPAQVVVEACGFWPAFARAVAPVAQRVVMVHPARVKAIAAARLKNDRVDSETLAHLSRCDLLPQAWMADEATQQLRLRVRLRVTLGRERARIKNLVQAVLHQEGRRKPVSDLFGKKGREWLASVGMSAAARVAVDTHVQLIALLDDLIAEQEQQLAKLAADDPRAAADYPRDWGIFGHGHPGRDWRRNALSRQEGAGQLRGTGTAGAGVGGQAQLWQHQPRRQ